MTVDKEEAVRGAVAVMVAVASIEVDGEDVGWGADALAACVGEEIGGDGELETEEVAVD